MSGTRERQPVGFGAVVLVVGALLLALILNTAYTTWAVNNSQRRWCGTIGLLNAADKGKPAPKTAYGRQLVTDFRHLYGGLGCGA